MLFGPALYHKEQTFLNILSQIIDGKEREVGAMAWLYIAVWCLESRLLDF